MQDLMKARSFLAAALLLTLCPLPVLAQRSTSRFFGPIDELQAVTLYGNVHPLARAEFDLGEVNASTRMDRMILVLRPTAAQQKLLDALAAAQQNPASPLYHQWLTPAAYGARFGSSAQNRARVVAWLKALARRAHDECGGRGVGAVGMCFTGGSSAS